MTELAYVERDSCILPPLVDETGLVLDAGTSHTCDHRTWSVVHVVQHGGSPQPEWVSPAPA